MGRTRVSGLSEEMAGQSEARSQVVSENVKLKLRKRLELDKLICGSVRKKVQVKS